MPETHQIFKATYSGIPVYEMICKGVAVMRRRSDSWLNATQILKVAGFDKPQRTRVLEREVQKGEHEKVQGGYGKYQGTWIPLLRGLELARQYNCEHVLRPIIDFQPAAKSPPLAPKHLVAATTGRPPKSHGKDRNSVVADDSDIDMLSDAGSEGASMTPSPSDASSSSRTPSPINKSPDINTHDRRSPKRKSGRRPPRYGSEDEPPGTANGSAPRSYGDQILEYFISDSNQVPPILINPPPDFDPNMAIDDDGHTALHWACAMGRIRIVKFLLSAGADIFKVNKSGQTALMRSVMFANNYDVRKFPELYELLHRSTLNIDNYNRTVFHHIVDVAMSKGKTHAARYYMETVLMRLADYPRELADIINFQDEDGETALTMAARCRSKRLVKILIDHGADPKIANRDGKSTEDYILEDERFRHSPVIPSRAMSMSFRGAHIAGTSGASGSPPNYAFAPANGDKAAVHYSTAAQKASTRCVTDMASMLDSLAASFDKELRDKERDLNQAHALLANIQGEILESQRSVGQLRLQAQGLEEALDNQQMLERDLHAKIVMRYNAGWQQWIHEEEVREREARRPGGDRLVPPIRLLPDEGSQQRAVQEDISDLLTLYGDIPTDPAALAAECASLRMEVARQHSRREELTQEYVQVAVSAGTDRRMNEYRRLIAAGLGGIPPAEVDSAVPVLLESLESEEPSSGTAATGWNQASAPPAAR
ncbi:hypothetical protein K488DRAFT_77467 [Vararia minispora EC-137]|uniref:Uncharacterized protein n=1 Tax=Vararia minispora EC-137 TaxID=1314806 RepID=A0ACB8QRB4_9AGAM|nr:hypothetical protein K488DRAFT_77467 [Vararia minispora EC-137]